MDFYCKVTSIGLIPLDDNDLQQKKRLRLGSEVRVHVTLPRNIKFHRKFFALLNIVFNNLPEDIQRHTNIYSVESLLTAIKIDIGYFDMTTVNKYKVVRPKSISFAAMDEAQFSKFYDNAVTDILTNYLPGADRNDLLNEVSEFISRLA